jgi:hypothetical protein
VIKILFALILCLSNSAQHYKDNPIIDYIQFSTKA